MFHINANFNKSHALNGDSNHRKCLIFHQCWRKITYDHFRVDWLLLWEYGWKALHNFNHFFYPKFNYNKYGETAQSVKSTNEKKWGRARTKQCHIMWSHLTLAFIKHAISESICSSQNAYYDCEQCELIKISYAIAIATLVEKKNQMKEN